MCVCVCVCVLGRRTHAHHSIDILYIHAPIPFHRCLLRIRYPSQRQQVPQNNAPVKSEDVCCKRIYQPFGAASGTTTAGAGQVTTTKAGAGQVTTKSTTKAGASSGDCVNKQDSMSAMLCQGVKDQGKCSGLFGKQCAKTCCVQTGAGQATTKATTTAGAGQVTKTTAFQGAGNNAKFTPRVMCVPQVC